MPLPNIPFGRPFPIGVGGPEAYGSGVVIEGWLNVGVIADEKTDGELKLKFGVGPAVKGVFDIGVDIPPSSIRVIISPAGSLGWLGPIPERLFFVE